MSILDKVAELATSAVKQSRKDADLQAWHSWNKNKSGENLSVLLKQVNPLIQREVNNWSGTLPKPLLESEGKRLAVMAFHNYDPDKGAALGTHTANYLKKMSRMSYSSQNIARLPENKMLMFHTYNMGNSTLTDQLGRAPTVDELSDHLGWSLKHVTNFQRDISHKEVLESGGSDEETQSASSSATAYTQDHLVDFIHHDLSPTQKALFEHTTGYGGAPILNNTQLMKKLKLTQGQLSYQKAQLVKHIDGIVESH